MNINSIRVHKDKLILPLIASSVIGVAISYSDLYLFHILSGILFVFWFYRLKENQYRFDYKKLFNKYLTFLYMMFIWYSISLIWAPDIQLAFKYLFYIFCGLIISFSIINYSYSLDRLNSLFKTLSIFFIFELFISLIESVSSFRMPISSYSDISTYFGKDSDVFVDQVNILSFSNFNPPTGFHWNTNDLAISMLMLLPFFLCNKKNIIKLFGAIFITTITIMTASRAVFLGLLLTYCLYLLLIKKKVGILISIWIFVVSLFWSMNFLSESDNPRVNEIANSIEALESYLRGDIDIGGSLAWRRELINNGINALYETFGLGLGAGGSNANQISIGPVAGRFTSMHNFWIELLVEGGIIFSILFFYWYSRIIYNLFLITKKRDCEELNYYSQSLFLSMIAFLPAAVAASSTIYFFPMWIMFGMSISVITIYKNSKIIN